MSFVFDLSISVGDWPAFHNSKLTCNDCKGEMMMMMVMVMMMMMMTTMRVGESEREMTFTAL